MPEQCYTSGDFVGIGGRLMISDKMYARTTSTIPKGTVTLNAAVVAGATSLTVNATTVKIYKGMPLIFSTGVYIVDADVAAGATAIPIKKARSASATALVSTPAPLSMMQVLSFQTASFSDNDETVKAPRVGNCPYEASSPIKKTTGINMNGKTLLAGIDPGGEIARVSKRDSTDYKVFMGLMSNDNLMKYGWITWESMEENIDVNDFFGRSKTAMFDGGYSEHDGRFPFVTPVATVD